MVAQTIVRQLSSVVKTSIWKVALPHEAKDDFQWRSWSECADASSQESRQT
jgi:hypothetical protein